MKHTRYLFGFVLFALVQAGCPLNPDDPQPNPTPTLVPPTQEALVGAAEIKTAVAGAVVSFSQRHGGIISVRSGHPTDADPEAGETMLSQMPPLEETHGLTEQAHYSALISFFKRHKSAFALTEDQFSLQVPKDITNPELPEFEAPNPNNQNETPAPRTLRVVQLYKSWRIQGRFAVGYFDPYGHLRSVVTRLKTPIESDSQSSIPAFGPAEAINHFKAQVDDVIQAAPTLHWLRSQLATAEISDPEILWVSPKSIDNLKDPLVLVYQLFVRSNANVARIQLDAHTGLLMRAADAMPQDWHNEGAVVSLSAPNERGGASVVRATRFDGKIFYGFGTNFTSPTFFADTHYLTISDSYDFPVGSRNLTGFGPLQMADTGANTFQASPKYTGGARAATDLGVNLFKTISWWKTRGLDGWDRRGSGIATSVRVNKSPDGVTPSLNAWGGAGMMQIGDGTVSDSSGNVFSLAASDEIVGHEYGHSVVDGTLRLAYQDESGAIHEALSDFFGAALSATGDTFNNTFLGEIGPDATLPQGFALVIRDMLNPSSLGQPEKYSDFVVTESDSGGVHTNSGILNKAHGLVVAGGTFNGVTVPAQGMANTEEVLRRMMLVMRLDSDTSMEEFAAHVLNFCDFLDLISRAVGSSRDYRPTCNAFGRAYFATELGGAPSARRADLAIERVSLVSGRVHLLVRNNGSESIDARVFARPNMRIGLEYVEAPAGASTYARSVDSGGEAWPQVAPGGTFEWLWNLPSVELAGIDTRVRKAQIMVGLQTNSGFTDEDPANNWTELTVASDYYAAGALWQVNDRTRTVAYHGGTNNITGAGHPTGFATVYLERTTANGPLSVMGGGVIDPEHVFDRSSEEAFGIRSPLAYFEFGPNGAPLEIADVVLRATVMPIPTDPSFRQRRAVWFNDAGGLPELSGQRQIYMLTDASDLSDETDETNNLICVNCRTPGQAASDDRGVTVFLNQNVNTDALFPERFRAAARKLKRFRPVPIPIERRDIPALPYRIRPL